MAIDSGKHEDPSANDSTIQVFFERTVAGAIRFCGQAVYMFRFLVSPPASLPRRIVARDPRLAPPLSFLTLGVFVAGMVQRIAYAVDPGESYSARAFAAEFHDAYSQISLWEVSLRTFPGVVLVVLVGVVVAKLVRSAKPFDRNPIVSTVCYAAGLHAMAFGLLYFLITWINAFYSTDSGSAIGHAAREKLLTGVVALTGLYGVLAIAAAIREAAGRKWAARFVTRIPISAGTTVMLLTVTYMTVEVSFDTGSAEERRNARWEQDWHEGFRVSLVESDSIADSTNRRSQLQATLALTNVSDEKILVPRPRNLVTADNKIPLNVVSSSLDFSEDKALVIEPNQTRVLQLRVDMNPLYMKLIQGEVSQRVLLPFHKALNGYAYNKRDHYLYLPLPDYGSVGGGLGLSPGTEIGRLPENGFGELFRK